MAGGTAPRPKSAFFACKCDKVQIAVQNSLVTRMGRPRKTIDELRKSGSYRPSRHGRPPLPPVHPVPSPGADPIWLSHGLTDDQGCIWRELLGFLPGGTLQPQDSYAYATLCRLISRERQGTERFSASDMGTLIRLLGKFGLTPFDRQKMPAARVETAEDRAAAKYFTGPGPNGRRDRGLA
jgi:hypothetical protein